MISTTELRIGNLLHDPLTGEWLKVIEITENNIITQVIDRDKFPLPAGWSTAPILLTPEILAKCGFKKDYTGFALDDKMSLSISITSDGEYLPCWLDKALFPGATRCIKYLHQLQNIYYILTGNELVINKKIK